MAGRPPKRKRLSPPERKRVSLDRDQRDDWWEYDRKGVRSKARARKMRIARRAGRLLPNEDVEVAENRFRLKMKKRWKKERGQSLRDAIARRQDRRRDSHGRKAANRQGEP